MKNTPYNKIRLGRRTALYTLRRFRSATCTLGVTVGAGIMLMVAGVFI
ncbi:MAG TPA: hypothetical protein VM571_07720 [Noviherbaspirillum sp.]|nr:hypothetical protein [Noviherbaspirillum sp.]